MPVSESFLGTCRTAIELLPELTTFRAALQSASSNTREGRVAAWAAAYDDQQAGLSPAYRLTKAIRDVVRAQADAAGNMSPLDRENAYLSLSNQYVTATPKPPTLREEEDNLRRIFLEDQLS